MKPTTLRPSIFAALIIAATLGGCLSSNDKSAEGLDPMPDSSNGASGPATADGQTSTTAAGGGGGGAVGGSVGGGGAGSGADAGTGSSGGSSTQSPTPGSTSTSASSSTASPNPGTGAGPAPVNLGTASTFVILSKAGITTTGTTTLTGDLGVSPIAGTSITGFTLVMDGSNEFATSPIVTGKVYAADYASPTPAKLTQAISDMQTASNDAAGRSAVTASDLGAGGIGGLTFTPGLYKWSTGVSVGSDIVLSGGPNDVWIFQVAQTLNVATGVHINLEGGAQAGNVYWQVGEQVTLGTYCDFKGNLITQTAIVFNTGATLVGRALAGTAVTLDANTLTKA